jgi:hypothetical protein
MRLPKYSMGVGDRFARQGTAQLQAFVRARAEGVPVAPVWNKSYREHRIVGSSPLDVRREADAAAAALGWTGPYFVDADHVGPGTVDWFLDACDFFTLDVADLLGAASAAGADAFRQGGRRCLGRLTIPGIEAPWQVSSQSLDGAAAGYGAAVEAVAALYRHLADAKGAEQVIVEVSMDETDDPQTPLELLLVLAALAHRQVPVQTIAPRFPGRFHKGVDYVGDVDRFARTFHEHLAVIRFAVEEFGLPENLKLSVHSGSDKFSLYGPMAAALRKFDAGVHLKTAGTTWLEELIGLAAAGGDGLAVAKHIYRAAYARREELCAPYATVIDVRPERLPPPDTVAAWSEDQFAAALRHDPQHPEFNPDLRQLLHVSYKVAAEMGDSFRQALDGHAQSIAAGVTENLYQRHLRPLFLM